MSLTTEMPEHLRAAKRLKPATDPSGPENLLYLILSAAPDPDRICLRVTDHIVSPSGAVTTPGPGGWQPTATQIPAGPPEPAGDSSRVKGCDKTQNPV